jgi:hypothetical protein
MATQGRDDDGQFSEKIRDQDILKAFDFEATADDPYLTVGEVRDALAAHWDIHVTDEAVRHRLNQMTEDDRVAKRQFGPGVAYRALVGPEPSDEVKAVAEEARTADRDEMTPLDEL